MRIIGAILCSASLFGCQAYVDAMMESPSDSGDEEARASAANDACIAAEIGTVSPMVILAARPAEEPKQMSQTAADAARRYQTERYVDALPLLRAVATGETGDSLDRREWAEYRVATSHYHLGAWAEAVDALLPIVARPSHSEHRAAGQLLLVITEQAEAPSRAIDALANYEPSALVAPAQRSGANGARAQVIVGRARLRLGDIDGARALFAAVDPAGAYGSVAQSCDTIAQNARP